MSARDDRNKREAERAHQILVEARGHERDALIAALVQEYAALLARGGRDPNRMPDVEKLWYRRGGRDALRHAATRLGVTDLHARAAEVVARGESS